MKNLELLSLEDQREISGGFIYNPILVTRFVTTVIKVVDSYVAGFKTGKA